MKRKNSSTQKKPKPSPRGEDSGKKAYKQGLVEHVRTVAHPRKGLS